MRHLNRKALTIPVAAALFGRTLALAKEGADQYPGGVAEYAEGQLPPTGTDLLTCPGSYSRQVNNHNSNCNNDSHGYMCPRSRSMPVS